MYTDKVIEHFKNPHNQGVIKNADAIGEKGNVGCGDLMKIYLKIKDDKIADIKFETFGCAAAIAVTSAMTDLAKSQKLEDAMAITKDDVVKSLGDLPPSKIHCSMLGIDALQEAIENYKKK
ncbi:iron-sulfur cluster assembly scaffold protein [Candidatus Parcubacteria bacterium]|nr:MAG: iron-sulfur cluster assembly scaffold protein [Candidatus Parcubacteria bacterium]